MALILNIETSSGICSVCVTKDGNVKGVKESKDEKSHAKLLTIFIGQLLKELNYTFEDLDAIAVSKGPGSYTGLRIGVSTAKGLCYAKGLPLISINTLELMTYGLISKIKNKKVNVKKTGNPVYAPMIDAKRMEVYSALFNEKGEFIRDVKAEIINENSYHDILSKHTVIFFGDGSDKIKDVIVHKNAVFIKDIYASSIDMAKLSFRAFENNQFENVAYFEPYYLKDFIATIPKKNIFK